MHTLHCQQCGNEFQAKRKDAKHCSDICRQTAKREKENNDKEPDNKTVTQQRPPNTIADTHEAPNKYFAELRKKKLGF